MTLAPEARAWVERHVGGIDTVRRLTGGIVSEAHELAATNDKGRRRWYVLRRYEHEDRYRPGAIAIEADTLRSLARTDIPAPELVAADPTGEEAGRLALLTRRLPGRVELRPDQVPDYTKQIATMAARIHDGLAIDAPPALDREWTDKPPGDWTRRPQLWRDVIETLATTSPPTTPPRFVHGDLHTMNLLWSRSGRLTGVVDWSVAMHGQPSRDLGHCRLNLAWLAGPALAEQLREAWEAETGWTLDPWWDLHALAAWGPGWLQFLPRQVGRRVRVDWDGATGRVESLVDLVLRRLR